ncbi:MAG: ferrous iron transport protein A [Bdellovibrionales bacterium]|nr:ferrous iron transport protein A [Bdellovibrionales bacterium]NQZ18772.1 ferrous iron transport protein A [Bdellovibrionales bacterium]
MKLSKLAQNQVAKITEIDIPSKEIKDRLSDFGLQVGQSISLVDKSPFGGPKAFHLSHGIFAIDPEVTENIVVEVES